MSAFIKLFIAYLGIWFLASLCNGILCSLSLIVFNNGQLSGFGILIFGLSLVFSAPFVLVVGLSTLVAQAAGKKGDALFQFTLKVALVCAIIAAVLFAKIFSTEPPAVKYFTGLSIIISALAALLFFRKEIKQYE